MAFMVPEYYHGGMWVCEDCTGESCEFPDFQFTRDEAERECDGDVVHDYGWWVRLQAPGYLDATGWYGPFEDEEGARKYMADVEEVDPDTGDELIPGYDEPEPEPEPKSEADRMMDFFFPKKRGSYLMNLKSWK